MLGRSILLTKVSLVDYQGGLHQLLLCKPILSVYINSYLIFLPLLPSSLSTCGRMLYKDVGFKIKLCFNILKTNDQYLNSLIIFLVDKFTRMTEKRKF